TIRSNEHAEIAVVLIQAAYTYFQVFGQFVAIIGLRHHGNKRDVQGDAVRTIVAHRSNELAIAEGMIAGEFNLADFDLRPFINLENQNYRIARSNPLVLRRDFGELSSVLAKQFLNDNFGFFDSGRIELAFDGQPNFAFLKAIQNVGL